MNLGLVELPEELISEIIEDVADFHVPPSRPSVGIQCLLDDSSVAALSLTCQKIRRLALPILFRSLMIEPEIILENTTTGFVEKKDMQPIVDALRTINPWKTECVKHLKVSPCEGDLQAFSLDILSIFPALEQIELPSQLWDDTSVLEAVHDHPTLQRCVFRHVDWALSSGGGSLPPPYMHKIFWQAFAVTEDNSCLQKYLDVGVQIGRLIVSHTSLDWTKLKFTSALQSICVSANITEQCSLLWDFVTKHPSIDKLKLQYEPSTAVFFMGTINPKITLMLEDPSEPVFRVHNAVLAKTNNIWRLEEIHLEIRYTEQQSLLDDFSGKLQRFGRYCPGLTNLTLTMRAPDKMSLLPGLSLNRVFKEAVSTMQNLKELSIDLPCAITSYIKARSGGLPKQARNEALGLSHSIATAAPMLAKIRYFNFFPSFHALARRGFFIALIERVPEVQVFEAEVVWDAVYQRFKYVAIRS